MLGEENARLRHTIESRFEIVGKSYAIRAVTDKIEKVAKTPGRVLIITPHCGVRPDEMLTLRPASTAATLVPDPRWQRMILASGLFISSRQRLETKRCEQEWKP